MLDCPAQLSLLSCVLSVEGNLEPVLKDKGILFFTMDSLWEMGWDCSDALWIEVSIFCPVWLKGLLCSSRPSVLLSQAAVR